MIYRKANQNDLEGLIEFLSLPNIDNSFVKPLSQRDKSIRERVYEKYKVGYWLLTLDVKKIIGCLALIPYEKPNFEISTFAVNEDYRGRGIGSSLIDEAIKIATELKHSRLLMDSWEGNQAVSSLMEKKGFYFISAKEDVGKRPAGIKTILYGRDL